MALTLSDLAACTGGEIVRGNPDLVLTGMASLDEAGEGDASFLGNEKYHPQFEKTRASAVIVGRGETGGPETCALISVENPTLAFSEVVRHFAADIQRFETGIHETAFVHPSAEVDPANGRISWPGVLQLDQFASQRSELEQLMSKWALYGGLGFQDQMECRRVIDTMVGQLKLQIREVPPEDYMASRNFLKSLQYTISKSELN